MTRAAKLRPAGLVIAGLLIAAPAFAKSEHASPEGPEVASRSYAQNYKDSALAFCIARAYSSEPKAYQDASATASGIDEFSRYDLENATGEVPKLVDQYLAREYHSFQGPEVKLNLMKCFDMYHSADLEKQVRRFVSKPKRTYNQDYPPNK
jgi:methionine synthase II (cobalamin-independent)